MKTSSLSRFVLSMLVSAALLSAACGKGGETTDPTGGQPATSSTSGAGGSSSTTAVTTGETSSTTVTTGGGCVPSPANGDCGAYLPAGETYTPPSCMEINGQTWTSGADTAAVTVKVVDGYPMIFFGAVLQADMDPVFDGFALSGNGVYYKMSAPDADVRFEGHFKPDCAGLSGTFKTSDGDHQASIRKQ